MARGLRLREGGATEADKMNVVLRMVHLKAWSREEGGGAEISSGWVLVCGG